jgi:predicted nucleic acid-binding protein
MLVHDWATALPDWLEVMPVDLVDDAALTPLGAGERGAITLALSLHAGLILIDQGTTVALTRGSKTGTLGVLSLAARRGLIDLADSFARLKGTNFRYRQEIMDALLDQQKR